MPSCGTSARLPASAATATASTTSRRCASARPAPADRARLQTAHERVLFVGARSCASRNRHSSGTSVSENSSEPISADDDRVRHRREDAALVALQREDRHVREDDDQHREQRRAARPPTAASRIVAARARDRAARVLAQSWRKMFSTHDHRAVDDDAEVHRAERQQVRRNAAQIVRPMKVASSASGIIDRDDAGGPQVAQEQIQHDRHQQRALEQVREHRVQRGVDQPGAVVERHDLHALAAGSSRSASRRVSLTAVEHLGRVLALAHQHDAGDDLVVVVLADHALARHRADRHVGDVADQQRRAAVLGDDDVADVVRRIAAGRCRESGTAARPVRCSCRRRWRCRGRAR